MKLFWKTVWQFLKKLNMELPYDPAIPFLGIDPKEWKTSTQTNICTHMFIEALFETVKKWKQPKYPSMDEWISKMWFIHSGILFSHKKE